MRAADPIDTARLALLLAELRLPAIKQVWADLAVQADKEGWPAVRFLAALAEHEMAERCRQVRFAGAGWPEQDQIGALIEPGVARGERHDLSLADHWDSLEVEGVEGFAGR